MKVQICMDKAQQVGQVVGRQGLVAEIGRLFGPVSIVGIEFIIILK